MGKRAYDAVPNKIRQGQDKDRVDAQSWADNYWAPIVAQRYEAAAKGESTPWLGVRQWLTEVPLNMNMRGAAQGAAIEEREKKFAEQIQELQNLAEQNKNLKNPKPIKIPSPWSGVR